MNLTPETPFASAAQSRPALAGNAICMLSMITWAMSFPLAEMLLANWSPLFLGAVRVTLAMSIMVPVWLLIEGPSVLRNVPWVKGLLIGGFGFGIAMVLFLIAQVMTDPVTVALIAAAAPVAGAVIEMQQGTRRISGQFVLGLLATLIGGIIATSNGSGAQLGIGAGLAILAVSLWTWGSMAAVRELPFLTPLGRSTVTFAGAMIALWIWAASAVATGTELLPTTPYQWWHLQVLMVYACIGMAFSQVLWLASVSRLGVALASFHMNLTPFYVMLIMAGLGAGWHWPQAYGAVLVGLGVLIAQRRTRPKPAV